MHFPTHQFKRVHYQLPPYELIQQTVSRGEGIASDSGALCIQTGVFTGRSPGDKFIVRDAMTDNTVHWNSFHQPMEEVYFLALERELLHYLSQKREVWVRDVYAPADPRYSMRLRVINEQPSANLFCCNLFLQPDPPPTLSSFGPQWHMVQAPGFGAKRSVHHTRSRHFVAISFSRRTILIGGTAYTGEIKKSVFTILNYLLPQEHGILPMHCSANVGAVGDVALFFGLSGTGKTTLSADPRRRLIGDDEHGWGEDSVFNFEGGCYAKVIDLCKEKEPAIADAIRKGALVENTSFFPNTNRIDFASRVITENTRASYPLSFISNAVIPSMGTLPRNLIFLTCDAYGVLPPLSKLTVEQAMYHFLSGYTAKIAGTEAGVTEPKATFSACFGAPFLPLHPTVYARLLGQKLAKTCPQVWLVNTGWTSGRYGKGRRIPLKETRAMIEAILSGGLDAVPYGQDEVFRLQIPLSCPGADSRILNPILTWEDKDAYRQAAGELLARFESNFQSYTSFLQKSTTSISPLTNTP